MKKIVETIVKKPNQPGMVGDGFRVYNYIPRGGITQHRISPFLMLDFAAAFNFSPTDKPRGVDVHPHKGFETVTIAYKGSVAHKDSAGNSGIINPGDVQWMTAGAGVLHKEYHEEEFAKKGGFFEMVQLWVNLPKKDKSVAPHYQALTKDNITKVALPENGGEVNIIAGNFNGNAGAAATYTDVNLFDIRLNAGGKVATAVPATHNTAALVIEGSVNINGTEAGEHSFVLFKNEGEEIAISASNDSVILLLSGEPIDEPIASYGPFVMNTQAEIYEAVKEFQEGKYGVLN
ncbi:pirin family protein [Niabella insulamsoli]|uniref:pirin family protein n=1 Tax=Niabella insulamsoli TaxID=3144874 RepID=UPI0031FC7D24